MSILAHETKPKVRAHEAILQGLAPMELYVPESIPVLTEEDINPSQRRLRGTCGLHPIKYFDSLHLIRSGVYRRCVWRGFQTIAQRIDRS